MPMGIRGARVRTGRNRPVHQIGPTKLPRGVAPPRDPRSDAHALPSFPETLLQDAFPRSAARLASLHRQCPRGSRPPTMALMRFLLPLRLRSGVETTSRSSAADASPLPPPEPDRHPDSCASRGGSAADCRSCPAARRVPSRALPPGQMGSGSPVPALLWFLRRALQMCARPRPASGLRSPARSAAWTWIPRGCSPRVPSLQGLPLHRTGARFVLPVPILLHAFHAAPVGGSARRPGVSRTAELACRFRLPTLLSFTTSRPLKPLAQIGRAHV